MTQYANILLNCILKKKKQVITENQDLQNPKTKIKL